MAERSPFANVMLFLILIALIVGFALTINVIDLWRLREETLITEVRGMKSDIGRLADAVQSGGLAVGTSQTQSRPALQFANANLRDPNAVEGDAIVMATGAETANLNYLINNESQVGDYWGMTYDTPGERSMTNPDVFAPKLATSWEISEDRKTITIHLRKGVYWHDFTDPVTNERFENVPVTAQDFKFFVEVVRNPGIPCEPLRVYYKDLDDLVVLDDYTFQVVWKEPYFLSLEFSLGLFPLPRHFYRFDPANPDEFTNNFRRNRMIVGCGPWLFDRWEKGAEISFRRNENYYGPKPFLRRITFKVIQDPNARFQALLNGEIDRLGLQPEQWVNRTNDESFNQKFNKFSYTARAYYYIGYNQRRDLFKDRRVRLALTHAVDRQRILKDVYYGLGQIITGPFFVKSPSYDHAVEPWPFDLDEARRLLAEAGWTDSNNDGYLDKNGQKFQFIFLTVANSRIFERIAEIVREDFAKIGISVEINPLEWSVYTQRLDEWNFDVCALGWSMGWDQDPYQIWHSSQAVIKESSNHVGFENLEADKLIEDARREFDLDKRTEMYNKFHRILYMEQPYTFLITPQSLIAQDKRFRNAKVYPLGMDINSFWVAAEEQKYRE